MKAAPYYSNTTYCYPYHPPETPKGVFRGEGEECNVYSEECNDKGQGHFSERGKACQPPSAYKLKPFFLSTGEQALTQLISDLPTEFLFVDPRTFQPSPYYRSRATPKDLAAIAQAWRRTIQEVSRCLHREPAE
jgi:hypothetical protein